MSKITLKLKRLFNTIYLIHWIRHIFFSYGLCYIISLFYFMGAALCLLIFIYFLLNMSVIDMLVVLNMFQFFCKKTMTRIDVVVLVFRYLTYHGSGMCLAAFVLLNLFCGLWQWFTHLFIFFLCSGMYSEIMLKKLTRLLVRTLRGGYVDISRSKC